MISLFLGPDDFSKTERIKALAEKQGLLAEFFDGQDNPPPLAQLSEQNLFSKARIFAVRQGIGRYEFTDANIELLASCANHVIFLEEKLDKRSAQNKKLLDNKRISVVEFPLPHGSDVDKWIIGRVRELGGKITPKAAWLLAVKIGRDNARETKFGGRVVEVKEMFDLWQLDNEIKKLLAYAAGREIAEADVENLVAAAESAEAFDIIDAIGAGNKQQAFALISVFLGEGTGDEKAKIIQLNALLSDQFRSIRIVQDLLARRAPDSEILEKTSWKSGRLFVMKKISAKFRPATVLDTLKKLEALDEELKSSSVPPKVLLDLIVAQMF